jgi:hypothetical protein
MLRFLHKDWIISRLFVAVLAPFYLLYGMVAHMASGMFFFFHILIASLLSVGLLAIEDRYRTHDWICSLPVRRRDVVQARYGSALLIIVLLFLLYLGYGGLLQLLLPRRQNWPPFGLAMLAIYLPVPVLTVSLLFPFYFRYGLGRGVVRLLLWLVAAAVLLTMYVGFTGGWGRFFHSVAGLASRIGGIYSIPGLTLTVFVVAAGSIWLSSHLSLHFFQREDL